MAQPVYDQHPLQTYFTESERDIEIMPGGDYDDVDSLRSGKLPFVSAVSWVLHALNLHPKSHSKAFAERFKYNVISSSLLSTSLQSTQRRVFHSRLPGRLSLTSETSSVYPTASPPLSPTLLDSFTDSHWPLTLTCMAVVALIADNFVLAALIATSTILIFHLSKAEKNVKPQTMSLSLEALDELIKAGNAWHSVVHDAVTMLESEEQSSFYGPTSTSSPSTSLRMALQSSLHTTQIQSDNIRQLFSALTSPADLAPLSEMYAPASPIKSTYDSSSDVAGPSTLRKRSRQNTSHTRARTMSVPDVPSEIDKRATWNGSYSDLARSNTSPAQMFRRKFNGKNRISEIPPLMNQIPSLSAPVTPSLAGVREEAAEELEIIGQEIELPRDYTMASGVDRSEGREGENLPVTANDGEQFGRSALDMRRKHFSGGLEAFRRMGCDSLGSPGPSSRHTSSSLSPSSRFTSLQTSRHPLSISALNLALQGALSAKRYTCSHLLALRFEEEEEYWEDVRSVMTLLTTSLVDATERLMEALDEADKRRIKDETPSLPSLSREASASPSNSVTSPPHNIIPLQSHPRSPSDTRSSHSHSHSQTHSYPQPLYLPQSLTPIPRHLRSHSVSTSSSVPPNANDLESPTIAKAKQPFRSIEQMISYAPTPSHLMRFAAHVDALTSALNGARENLEQCVTTLRDTASGKKRDPNPLDVSLDDPFVDPQPHGSSPTTINATAAIEAYERVRKELGLAFRECERGRDHLLHHIQQVTGPPSRDVEDVFSDMEEVPALGHDNGTDESAEERGPATVGALLQASTLVVNASIGHEDDDDSFSKHLESQLEDPHPNFIGVEEVFEADTEDLGGFKRDRSKLTREERIALAKARRERKELGLSPPGDWTINPSGTQDRKTSGVGPGVEVVQELKDVIWRVGERRRKMAEQQLSMSGSSSSSEYSSASGSLSSPVAVSSPMAPSLTLQDVVTQRRIPSPFTRVDSS